MDIVQMREFLKNVCKKISIYQLDLIDTEIATLYMNSQHIIMPKDHGRTSMKELYDKYITDEPKIDELKRAINSVYGSQLHHYFRPSNDKRSNWYRCPRCGAYLDPGERCDCES